MRSSVIVSNTSGALKQFYLSFDDLVYKATSLSDLRYMLNTARTSVKPFLTNSELETVDTVIVIL